MPELIIDRTRIRMTPEGEVIVPLDIWERLLKIAEEAEGWRETIYLLQSEAMRKRLLEARHDDSSLTLEEIREKPGSL